MRDACVRAVLLAVYRWNQRKRTFVHVPFARWHCRCEASVEQSVILACLLTVLCVRTKYRNDFIVQSADVVNRRIHRQIRCLIFMVIIACEMKFFIFRHCTVKYPLTSFIFHLELNRGSEIRRIAQIWRMCCSCVSIKLFHIGTFFNLDNNRPFPILLDHLAICSKASWQLTVRLTLICRCADAGDKIFRNRNTFQILC